MSALSDYRTKFVGTETILNFIECPDSITVPGTQSFHLVGIDAEDNSIESNSSLEDVPDVTSKNQGKYRKTGAATLSNNGMYLKGEPVSEYIKAIHSGADSKINENTTLYHIDISGIEPVAGVYKACPGFEYGCIIDAKKFGGAAGEKIKYESDIALVGDPIAVSVDYDSLTGKAIPHVV